ncbi:MAG: betaine/proline/choline family ABC transporter ATP-binding protein [Geminicoccaceae bacterium]|nr:betaine/proline/choline family ABC transporter ATP-binding protein [Geminicoccaceae bacterium]
MRASPPPDGSRAGDGDGPAVLLENVWKIFGDRAGEALKAARDEGLPKSEILRDLHCVVGVADAGIRVERGEIFCVMGLSGSGKSTLLRHVNRLLEPTAGRVLVQGRDVTAMNAGQLRDLRARRIGMVFQNFALLPHRNVRDNVALPLEIQDVALNERFDLAEAALEKVGLSGWGDRFPASLSGGMQQRVGLARALAADPPILLMDEPFSALDPLIRRQLQDQFLHLSHAMQKTAVFVTHDLDEAIRIGNRIAIMKDGVIVQTGTPEDIVAHPRDDYVASFVANISRLHVVHAAGIMEPVAAFRGRAPGIPDIEAFPRARADMTIAELIDLAAGGTDPLAVTDGEGRTVGVIDNRRLLTGIRGDAR